MAELIGSDPSLSARLVRLVNSAYFAIPGGVTEIATSIEAEKLAGLPWHDGVGAAIA